MSAVEEKSAQHLQTKTFGNNLSSIVSEALDGLILQTGNDKITRFNNVVIRNDWDPKTTTKVALISGGGSGHEPSHAGFVGAGMLTGAVCGEIFSSPSTDAVLNCIRAVTGSPGALLIIKNYTGDILNFKLAAEMARMEGYSVETVIIDDDCALPREKCEATTGRRGIAGTVFVHKVAGYVAEMEESLAEVKAAAESVIRRIGSFGVASDVCHLPGQATEERMGPTEIEMGLGIHGEPGLVKAQIQNVSEIVREMIGIIVDSSPSRNYFTFAPSNRVAVLVNNLGGITPIEMGIVAKDVCAFMNSQFGDVRIERLFVGPFMTSLDMKGFSITFLRVEQDSDLAALDLQVGPSAWIPGVTPTPITYAPVPSGVATEEKASDSDILTQEQSDMVDACVGAAASALISAKDELNALDRQVGDGDCGTTLAIAGDVLNEARPQLSSPSLSTKLRVIGDALSRIGGSSGALYGYLFVSAARKCQSLTTKTFNAINVAKICRESVDGLSQYGGAQRGDRTMIDALAPAAQALVESLEQGSSVEVALQNAAQAAKRGCDETKNMTARRGRSTYVNEQSQKGIVDPGAKGVAIWADAIARCQRSKMA